LRRVVIVLGAHQCDVLVPEDAWAPVAGDTCRVDLSRARVYPVGN
jgi:hypothetical protein